MSKFKQGDIVLYKNGERYQLGEIKEVLEFEETDIFNDIYIKYKYRVWYHSGNTTAITDESLLIPIDNIYNFTVIRHSVESDIECSPARRLAIKILQDLELYGDFYYKVEDWLTNFLEGREEALPLGHSSEYLECAMRVEVKNYLQYELKLPLDCLTDEDIEEIVHDILYKFGESVLDMNMISWAIKNTLTQKGINFNQE